MKITILGSGSAAPRILRNMSGYLLEIGGKKILMDTGPGTIRQLLRIKKNILDIDHIFHTHFHNDHINDLQAILWSNNYGDLRKKPLNIYGPRYFESYYDLILNRVLKPKKLFYKVNIKEMIPGTIAKIPLEPIIKKSNNKNKFKYNHIRIKSTKTRHTYNSIAYRIDYNNKSILYSGDSDYTRNLINLGKNVDLMILECSLPNNKKVDGHLTPELCVKIAKKANAKTLVLTHFYPECDKVDIKKQCKKEFNGKIVLGKDLMEIKP